MDERDNLPSASSMARYAACPGSFLLEQSIEEPEQSTDAALGHRVHAALAGEAIELTTEERDLVERIKVQETNLRYNLDLLDPRVIREKRFWFTGFDFRKEWSGKPDVVFVKGDRALIIDYKTGRGEVEDASSNLQLRALAVLVNNSFDLRYITVAIIQPLVSANPSVCSYTKDDIMRAHDQVCALMERIKLEYQPRNPTPEGCKYCKARGVYCPESRQISIQSPMENLPEKITPDAIASTLTSQKLGEFLERAAMAESIIEACKEEAKRRLADGDIVPGWKLKPGSVRDTITKPEIVFGRFLAAGGTQEQFMPAVSVAKSKFKDALKEATGKKGKELDEQLVEILDDCVETKQTAPSLVKSKE